MQVSLISRGVELHFATFEYMMKLSDLCMRLRIAFPTENSLKISKFPADFIKESD